MKKIYVAMLLSLAIANSACTKFLDVKPIGQLIPTKVEDLENLLNNTNTIDYHFFDNNRCNPPENSDCLKRENS